MHKKFIKAPDPVMANKKFFRLHPHLKEFAKYQPLAKESDIDFLVSTPGGGQAGTDQ